MAPISPLALPFESETAFGATGSSFSRVGPRSFPPRPSRPPRPPRFPRSSSLPRGPPRPRESPRPPRESPRSPRPPRASLRGPRSPRSPESSRELGARLAMFFGAATTTTRAAGAEDLSIRSAGEFQFGFVGSKEFSRLGAGFLEAVAHEFIGFLARIVHRVVLSFVRSWVRAWPRVACPGSWRRIDCVRPRAASYSGSNTDAQCPVCCSPSSRARVQRERCRKTKASFRAS